MPPPLPHDLPRPETLLDFVRLFPDDEACAEYLFKVRWPAGFECPKCESTRYWKVGGKPGTVQCENNHRTTVTAGTIMHRTRQPLRTWFYAAYLVSTLTPGISAVQFQKQLGIKRYETAFNMLHKLRSALVAPGRDKLSGDVEVDEAFVGGPEPGKKGRTKGKKALVVVAVEIIRWKSARSGGRIEQHDAGGPPDRHATKDLVERTRAGRVRMTVIPDATAGVILPWVESNVEPGSTVYTDGWKSYNGLAALGYTHERVLQTHKGTKTGKWLPLVHLMISNLKRWLLGTHKGAVRPQHLQAYLNEFTFRFNRRFWRGPAFLRSLGLAVHAESWPEYATLYKGEWLHPSSDTDARVFSTIREQFADSGHEDMVEWINDNMQQLLPVIQEARRENDAKSPWATIDARWTKNVLL